MDTISITEDRVEERLDQPLPGGRGSRQRRGGALSEHHGFICDGCEMEPMVGPRYRCTVATITKKMQVRSPHYFCLSYQNKLS